jgi:hypothetical protein
LEKALDAVYAKFQDACDRCLSREQMAARMGEVLNDLAPGDGADLDDEDADSDLTARRPGVIGLSLA